MAAEHSMPEVIEQRFERLYREWRSHVEESATPYSSSDRDYIQNPNFDAIVNLGWDALPFIMEKLRSDQCAHFLVHALARITGLRFSPEELEACRSSGDRPVGNQSFVRLWLSRWDSQQISGARSTHQAAAKDKND